MYSTEASNWFNQSALAAKDGSARPQRTTHERRPDHHDDGGDGDCGDGGDFDDHDYDADDEDDDDDDEKRVVVPVLMCGGNKKSPSHPTLVCQMLLTITRIMTRIIIMIMIMMRIIVAVRHHQGYDYDHDS